jgi:hypothetical protein
MTWDSCEHDEWKKMCNGTGKKKLKKIVLIILLKMLRNNRNTLDKRCQLHSRVRLFMFVPTKNNQFFYRSDVQMRKKKKSIVCLFGNQLNDNEITWTMRSPCSDVPRPSASDDTRSQVKTTVGTTPSLAVPLSDRDAHSAAERSGNVVDVRTCSRAFYVLRQRKIFPITKFDNIVTPYDW